MAKAKKKAKREEYAARVLQKRAAEMYKAGRSIESIAKALGVEPRVARGAVYLASRADASLGLGSR